MILITHDLGVVAETATHVMVMYAGRRGSTAGATRSSTRPQHPYTWGLLESMPPSSARLERLVADRGLPAVAAHPPPGLRLPPALQVPLRAVRQELPPLGAMPGGHLDACHLAAERKREIWSRRSRRGRRR